MVLFPTSKEWALAPEVQRRKRSRPFLQKDLLSSTYISQRLHRFPCSYRDPVTQSVTNKIASVEQVVGGLAARVAALEAGAVSASVSPPQCDPGPHQDSLMVPQPQGPMAQGHRTTTGTRDAGLILARIQTMKMLEVPFYCSSLANTATEACPLGPKRHLQQPVYMQPICPPGNRGRPRNRKTF